MSATAESDLFHAGEYVSEFEGDSECSSVVGDDVAATSSNSRKRHQQDELFKKPFLPAVARPARTEFVQHRSDDEWQRERQQFLSMNAYSRHKKMVNDYLNFYGGSMADFQRDTSTDRNDLDVVRDHHRFLWQEGEDLGSWERRIARKYWDKLFKEYGIADLRRYRDNKIGLRWRMQTEVVAGKGQFACGARQCAQRKRLRSWEVNFAYVEAGVRKNALVKVRLCPACSDKLNYHSQKREVQRQRLKKKKAKRVDVAATTKAENADKDSDGSSSSSSSSGSDDDDDEKEESTTGGKKPSSVDAAPGAAATAQQQLWKRPAPALDHERTKEDEFEDYFQDLFL